MRIHGGIHAIDLDIDAHRLINDGESVIQAAVAALGIIQIAHGLAASALAKGQLEIVMAATEELLSVAT